jgi:hypothetical protein
MAKFAQTEHKIWMIAVIASLAGCGESEQAPPAPPAPLTVGGTVSGLAGRGLILQLNGANDLSVNTNGKFNFPRALSKGNTYAVTVRTSPASPVKQICTVNQGSGSIDAAAIKSVTVVCTTSSFAVGGTVSRLSGKGLVLQLNGANDLAIAKNGNFIFPNVRLPDGSDYSVSIKSLPAKQKCEIKTINIAPDNDTLNIVAVTCSKNGHSK